MGHKDITKVPQRSILWSAGPGYVTCKTGSHVQSPRALFASFSPPFVPKGQQEPPNAHWVHPMHPKALGGFYFPRPHPNGCLPLLQALQSRQENIPLFIHAWFQQGILTLYQQLNWSCSPVEQCFHRSWASTLTPLI